MANKKISELGVLSTVAGADFLAVVDDTDSTTKQLTVTNLMAAAPQGDLEAANNLSDLNDAATARTNLGLGTAATSASTDFSPAFYTIVAETGTARTLSDSDNGKVIVCSNSSQSTLTIPSGLTSGFGCTIVQNGSGVVSVVGSGGATVSGISGKVSTAGQYAALNVVPTGTNAYILDGDGQTPPFGNTYSVDFDGSNDYAAVTTATDNIYSLSMWFKPDSSISSSSAPKMLVGTVAGSHYIALGSISSDFTDEVITVYRGAGGFAYTSNTATISTSWNHLFVSWLSSSTTNSGSAGYDIWLNGTQVGNTAAGSIPTAPMYWGSSSKIGTRSNIAYPFGGKIDELATWTSDVSADVANIYNGGNGAVDLDDTNVVSTGPAHWWRMGDDDSGTGTTITDQGSGGSNATLTNGPTFSTDIPS